MVDAEVITNESIYKNISSLITVSSAEVEASTYLTLVRSCICQATQHKIYLEAAMGAAEQQPLSPRVDPSSYPKLDRKQAGHLRHFYNLVSQPDGEWHHFGSVDPHNEFDDAARYQLATMYYAMTVAHFHRLPALRGPFKSLMRRTIHKMMRMYACICQPWSLLSFECIRALRMGLLARNQSSVLNF